ncbi:hypothetical protein Pyn_17990 [Prunus yedoensis var. nudiflora]|uniref:NPH3 domain-containing protein n=1 Tax=Prunus yedoensis var. nudiflora TaxID=2094558 RepID=A0A314UQP8_PRUYE|nr:hypothetical protein Pyn_17990 [Prunus yedoensis var. nudiflora]
MLVGKLIDKFLSEIASDVNLKPDRFYNLAISLPEQARLFDDDLYRAVDLYLKAHPWIPKLEREKICGILDCQKLTLEACTHAAQNERLPLRTVVQVLFFKQLQHRHAIAGTLLATDVAPPDSGRPSLLRIYVQAPNLLFPTWQHMKGRNCICMLATCRSSGRVPGSLTLFTPYIPVLVFLEIKIQLAGLLKF